MAYKIHWSPRASDDFDAIYTYYRNVAGKQVALNRLSKIIDAADIIEYMPYIGQRDKEYPHTPDYRYLTVLDYRIYYYVEDNIVNIAAIWDCRQGSKVFDENK